MNPQQAAFLRQAQSDWAMFQHCRRNGQPVCHELHFLQMATEKLAKAYLWGTRSPAGYTHASFVHFLRLIAQKSAVRDAMEFQDRSHLRAWIYAAIPLAAQIGRLAPKLAGVGPNPEYPWPAEAPTIAPVDHRFPLADELIAEKGKTLIRSIDRLLATFAEWG